MLRASEALRFPATCQAWWARPFRPTRRPERPRSRVSVRRRGQREAPAGTVDDDARGLRGGGPGNVLPVLSRFPEASRWTMLCSDEQDAPEIVDVGNVDNKIRIALRGGISTLEAVRMDAVNPALYYRVDHFVGSIAPASSPTWSPSRTSRLPGHRRHRLGPSRRQGPRGPGEAGPARLPPRAPEPGPLGAYLEPRDFPFRLRAKRQWSAYRRRGRHPGGRAP